ncbi:MULTISPECIES: hypothetical protein [unclassified Streptomyces]|uniref:hypothetical protein n=1 Tax=unclassified Streptomyces TaxID=2593676 RepID=UPI0033D97054
MPAYLIRHRQGEHGDILAEDVDTLTLNDHWAILHDHGGIAFAIPIDHVASIERVDEPQGQPAPSKE